MTNNLFFDIPFFMNNNPNLTIKIFSTNLESVPLLFTTLQNIVSQINWQNLLSGSIAALSCSAYVASESPKLFQTNWHKTRTLFSNHYLYRPPPIFSDLYTSFIIFSISLYLSLTIRKWYTSLPSWNIEKGSIIWYGAPTIQICIKPWNVLERSCHTYGNKFIGLTHLYKCSLIRGGKYWNRPPQPLSPLPSKIIRYILSKPLKKLPNLTLIKPTQYLSAIQPLYHFETT